jgi:hypothetical protein
MGWRLYLLCFVIGILLFLLADDIFVKLPNSFVLKYLLCFIGATVLLAPAINFSRKQYNQLKYGVFNLNRDVTTLFSRIETQEKLMKNLMFTLKFPQSSLT